ncbi:hypothetical protein [Paracoccus simplex]|uniref:Uncharacterized protein n=1 Tax=Paracoccus simplex TaxID=2086346 RepID=A0ABV7S565_9RHOB
MRGGDLAQQQPDHLGAAGIGMARIQLDQGQPCMRAAGQRRTQLLGVAGQGDRGEKRAIDGIIGSDPILPKSQRFNFNVFGQKSARKLLHASIDDERGHGALYFFKAKPELT